MGEAAIPIMIGLTAMTAAGSTALQVNQAQDANHAADQQADLQKKAQGDMENAAQAQAKQMKDQQAQAAAQAASQSTSAAQGSNSSAKALAAGAGTRADTILTSPLGLTSAPAFGGGKTLLGA